MIHIAICDDDRLQIEILEKSVRSIVQRLEKDVDIDTFDSGNMLIEKIKSGKYYPIILLDLEMPESNGFEICRKINILSQTSLVIFVSIHEKYVFDAFKVHPYRFVPKMRFKYFLPEAIKGAINHIEQLNENSYCYSTREDEMKILYRDILYIHCQGKYTYIECCEGDSIKLRRTLKEVFSELDNSQFVWLERGYICNLDKIRKISGGYADLVNGERLIISRDRIKEVKNSLRKYLMARENRP